MVKPAMEPPAGEQAFVNPDKEMYYWCIIANSIAIPICTVVVILRIYARYRLQMKVQADDSRFANLDLSLHC
jgi:hypothetical protein